MFTLHLDLQYASTSCPSWTSTERVSPSRGNWNAAAHAVDKTGCYFTEREVREEVLKNPNVRKFADAARAFESMSFEEKEKWQNRTGRCPSIEELANR